MFHYPAAYLFRTTRINVNGILIEYEGEDSGIGLLFASKAAVQVVLVVIVVIVVMVTVVMVEMVVMEVMVVMVVMLVMVTGQDHLCHEQSGALQKNTGLFGNFFQHGGKVSSIPKPFEKSSQIIP